MRGANKPDGGREDGMSEKLSDIVRRTRGYGDLKSGHARDDEVLVTRNWMNGTADDIAALESELAQAAANVDALEKAIRNALDEMGDNREVILERALAPHHSTCPNVDQFRKKADA